MGNLPESSLYGPVRDYLEGLGYEVKGEVKDCDIAAMRDGELIVVELKRGFTMELSCLCDKFYMTFITQKRKSRHGEKIGRAHV